MGLQILLSKPGPLPIQAAFISPGDIPLYLIVNGSVWTQTANQMIGINIQVDGQLVGTAKTYSNANSTHRAVVPAYIPIKLGQGQHTIVLSAAPGTTVSDFNDLFTAVLQY